MLRYVQVGTMRIFICLALISVMAAGCGKAMEMVDVARGPQIVGSGKTGSATKKVGSFKTIELHGSFDANFSTGPQTELKIEGDDNLVNLVLTDITDGK